MFNQLRLSLARKRRRMTAKALAEAAGVAPLTITRLEKGENQPDEETVQALAKALDYPVEFFSQDDPETVDVDAASFRSLSKMSAKERDAAIAAGALGLQLSNWIEDRFDLPEANLPDLSQETDPEAASRYLRHIWAIGNRPVGNLIALLEAQGIRVLALSENTASVDAFSFWRDAKPYVFLNTFKTAERSRFDAAHELGHLVLHRHGGRHQSKNAEREADHFASAFLMPADDVKAHFPRGANISLILNGKRRWRVSAMALAYRLRQLGKLSDWQYKNVCVELSRRGFRKSEPGGIERETSSVLKKVLVHLWNDRTTKADIATDLGIPFDELEGLIGFLVANESAPTMRSLTLASDNKSEA